MSSSLATEGLVSVFYLFIFVYCLYVYLFILQRFFFLFFGGIGLVIREVLLLFDTSMQMRRKRLWTGLMVYF